MTEHLAPIVKFSMIDGAVAHVLLPPRLPYPLYALAVDLVEFLPRKVRMQPPKVLWKPLTAQPSSGDGVPLLGGRGLNELGVNIDGDNFAVMCAPGGELNSPA